MKFQHDVKDFYFLSDKILDNFDYKSFLIIITASNFIVYRESKRKIIKKIFALPGRCDDLKKVNFSLMYKTVGTFDKSVHDIKGIFFTLNDNTIDVFIISNLFEKNQSLLED